MADITYMGSDEESLEIRALNVQVREAPDEFENWEKLVRAAESQEGGLNRNSHPQQIADTRAIYDGFLTKFPLLFGYWKKYADLEFSIAGTEAAELVQSYPALIPGLQADEAQIYERGVSSIINSVDLWTHYCSFKMDTCHDYQLIRDLFERAALYVGLDFMAHPFWDKYLEFEDRVEAHDKAFAIYERLSHIPMHQYARYFEKFRQIAPNRPIDEISTPDVVSQFKSDIEQSGMYGQQDVDAEVRTRVDAYYLEVYHRTNTETNKRWPYESKIGRPYFHVQELDEEQLVNWRKYLTFEEIDGNYTRIVFLYERCLVTCALYDEFWMRYARWMGSQSGKEEETRNIFQRASCTFVPIGRPAVRLLYATFEESQGRVDVAKDIHEAILAQIPGHLEVIQSLAHLVRRQGGLDESIKVFRAHIESKETNMYTKGSLAAEWAKSLWRIKGKPDEARAVFTKNAQYYLDSRAFWINWLEFEIAQPTSAQKEENQYKRIKAVAEDVRKRATLPPQTTKDLIHYYMEYLLMRGTKDSAKEYMELDRQVNGSFVVQEDNKIKLAEDGNKATTERRLALENGHPGLEVDEAQIRKGHNIYNKYYQQQGEAPV